MTIFVIKIIACLTMVIDHIRYAIPTLNEYFIFKYFGRVSFPLFAFCLVEGYTHTSDLKKYIKRLLIFAFISQIPFTLFSSLVEKCDILEVRKLNIMFTLYLGMLSIILYEKSENKFVGFLLTILVAIFGMILKVDYLWYGVMMCFVLFISRKNKKVQCISYIFLVLLYYAYGIWYRYAKKFLPLSLYDFIKSYKKNVPSILFTIIPKCV